VNSPLIENKMNSSPLRPAPTRPFEILKQLGPGLIIAASIVGSGELIATTLTGAKAGISLLWLIVLGCVIKVFAQIEIGRFTITTGIPTLSAMAMVPGPRIRGRGNWLVWYWFFMWFCSIAQLGGIAGACGQVLALAIPLTQQGQSYNEIRGSEIRTQINQSTGKEVVAPGLNAAEVAIAKEAYNATYASSDSMTGSSGPITLKKPWDDRLWAVPIAVITAIMLVIGKYGMVQTVATILVATFTFITMGNVLRLQMLPDWQITTAEIAYGLSFHLPQTDDWKTSLLMALAVVGVIGVGAAELVQYPYWCIEKGYAKWTGRDDGSEEWVVRARGWLRVMKVDAWVSMIIYTVATICFFLLGVAILHRTGVVPQESTLLQTLSLMYEPVLSTWAPIVFILGAFAVLYSTFYVANASHARTFTDGLCVMGVIPATEKSIQLCVKILCGLFPFLCLAVYWVVPEPGSLVFLSGAAQAIMLPMMCAAALYFRYFQCHPRLRPSRWSDAGLWLSSVAMSIVGIYSLINESIRLASRWLGILLVIATCSFLLTTVGCSDASTNLTASGNTDGPPKLGSLKISKVPLRIQAEMSQDVLDAITRRWQGFSEQPIDLSVLDNKLFYNSTKELTASSGGTATKPQVDIIIAESRWLGTLAERKWVRPLPTSLADTVPAVPHWERVAKYGQRLWGIPLGTNFLASIAFADNSALPQKGYGNSTGGKDIGESIGELEWIVDRFLVKAAAANPTPSDSSFLFKPTGAKSRLTELWLADVATSFSTEFSAQQPDVKWDDQSLFRLGRSAESAWELTRDGVFSSALGWPDVTHQLTDSNKLESEEEKKTHEQKLTITAPEKWVDSGRTLLATIADTNRQSAASEIFLRWLNDDAQRLWLAEITPRITSLPGNTRRVTDRPDRDTYHQLIASAVNDRYVTIELQFDGADKYKELLGLALVKLIRGESDAIESLQSCNREWESLTNTRGRERQQKLLYRALELAKWE